MLTHLIIYGHKWNIVHRFRSSWLLHGIDGLKCKAGGVLGQNRESGHETETGRVDPDAFQERLLPIEAHLDRSSMTERDRLVSVLHVPSIRRISDQSSRVSVQKNVDVITIFRFVGMWFFVVCFTRKGGSRSGPLAREYLQDFPRMKGIINSPHRTAW